VDRAAEPLGGAQPSEGVDPELLALPAPARGRRIATMTVMALAVTAASVLLAALRSDLAYFFQSSTVTDLGEATELAPAALVSNRYVSVRGTPMASRTVTYRRLFGGQYEVFPLAGQRRVFVQRRIDAAASQDARREFAGRLVTMGSLGGRFAAVRRAYAEMGVPVTAETFVLLADEPPTGYGWALALAALCVLFGFVNLLLLLRWFRPIRLERHARA